MSLHVRRSLQTLLASGCSCWCGQPADLYGQQDRGGASAKLKQPAGVVWYRGTTAVGVPLLSLLILPVAFLVGHGLSTWMEL